MCSQTANNGAQDKAGLFRREKLFAVLLLKEVATVQGARIPELRTVHACKQNPVLQLSVMLAFGINFSVC